MDIPSKVEEVSYFNVICYNNQENPGAISNKVGIYIHIQVFRHGQLYVAFSRVTKKGHAAGNGQWQR